MDQSLQWATQHLYDIIKKARNLIGHFPDDVRVMSLIALWPYDTITTYNLSGKWWYYKLDTILTTCTSKKKTWRIKKQ